MIVYGLFQNLSRKLSAGMTRAPERVLSGTAEWRYGHVRDCVTRRDVVDDMLPR
jgi:hypothetical protein